MAIEHDLPDEGHEVLWMLRDGGSGEVLLAQSLLDATEDDLARLLEEMAALCQKEGVLIAGVISDGQYSLRKAVAHGGATMLTWLQLTAAPQLRFGGIVLTRQLYRWCSLDDSHNVHALHLATAELSFTWRQFRRQS